jgi:hypothetical protein
MHNDLKIAGWIEDELEIRQSENDDESPEGKGYEAGLFFNVLANNIDELLGNKELTFDLVRYFIGHRKFTEEERQMAVISIGFHMSQEQLPVLLWVNEAAKALPVITL